MGEGVSDGGIGEGVADEGIGEGDDTEIRDVEGRGLSDSLDVGFRLKKLSRVCCCATRLLSLSMTE